MAASPDPRPPAGLVSSAALNLLTRVAAFLFSLVSNVILARALGPEGRGVYAVAVLIPALIGLLAQLGIGPANVYFLSKGLIGADELVGHAISIGLLLGAVCFLLVLGYVEVERFGSVAGITSTFVLVSCISLPFALITAFLQGVLTGAQRFVYFNLSILTQYSSQTVALVVALLLHRGSTMGAVVAWTVSTIISAAVTAGCVLPLARLSLRFRMTTVRLLLRFGLLSYLGSLTSFVNYRFDVLLVNLFAGARQVGLYAVGTGLAEIVWYVANAAGIVLAPRVASAEPEEADRLTEAVCRVVTFLALVAGAALALFAPIVVVLVFGSAFVESVWAVWLLLPGIVTFSIARILSMYLLGRNQLKVDLVASFAGLVITLALDLVLIPRFGFRGAAVASSFAYTCAMAVDLFWVTRRSSISLRALLVPGPQDGRLLVQRIRETFSGLFGTRTARDVAEGNGAAR